MHVSYLYDMALPFRFAAAIHILNTAHALACRGYNNRCFDALKFRLLRYEWPIPWPTG